MSVGDSRRQTQVIDARSKKKNRIRHHTTISFQLFVLYAAKTTKAQAHAHTRLHIRLFPRPVPQKVSQIACHRLEGKKFSSMRVIQIQKKMQSQNSEREKKTQS
jgi:ribosomal protein S30